MKRRLMLSFLVIGLVSALVGGATFAYFTDSATNAENTFTAGTVDINSAITSAWSSGFGNMAPGDSASATITVTNGGSLELRYDVAQVISGNLFSDLGDAANTPAVVTYTNDGIPFTPGDNNFVLAPEASDSIVVTVTLPTTADNDYQGVAGNLDLAFNAEQTANNP